MSKYFGFGNQKTTINGSGEMNRSWTSSYNENFPQDSSYKTWTGSGSQDSSHSHNAWASNSNQQSTFNDSSWSSSDFSKNSWGSSWLSSDSSRSRSDSASSSHSTSDSSKSSSSSSGSLFNNRNTTPDADCKRRLMIQGWANGTF